MVKTVIVGVSARHVHLTEKDVEILFGEGHQLHIQRKLRQPGAFACEETVAIVSNAFTYENVRVVGPIKPYTQIEISRSDAYFLKINPPVRESSDFLNTPGLTIIGPRGKIVPDKGCIIPQRHIHIGTADAQSLGIVNGQTVCVRITGCKSGMLEDVSIKIADSYQRELHVDIDDANAFFLNTGDVVELIL